MMNLEPVQESNLRAFVILELIRDKVLLDVITRGGFVLACRPTGLARTAAEADKLLKELDKVEEAPDMPELHEEIGDVFDVVERIAQKTCGDLPRTKGLPDILSLTERLLYLQDTLRCAPALPEALYSGFLAKLASEALTVLGMGIFFDANKVEELRCAKQEAKGPHSGWYAEAILLPADDEWCPYYARKFAEVNPRIFNLGMALTADQLRHPPG